MAAVSDAPRDFATIIKKARGDHMPPLTQEALAAELNLQQPTVSAWEMGRARPGYSVIVQLSEVLNLDLADLVRAAAVDID